MKHVVIGAGNLGIDIYLELLKSPLNEVLLLRGRDDFKKWYESLGVSDHTGTLWYCAGFGSVKECKEDPRGAIESHAMIPYELMTHLPSTWRLCFFSTDYVAYKNGEAPRSFYEVSKVTLELLARQLNRPKTAVVRVSSLHGKHRPERCLGYKVFQNSKNPITQVRDIYVTPTLTDWVAHNLINNQDALFSQNMALLSAATTNPAKLRDLVSSALPWANVEETGRDPERPYQTNIGNFWCSATSAEEHFKLFIEWLSAR